VAPEVNPEPAKPKTPQKPLNIEKTKRSQTMPFRPTNRQPLALLTILDDGSREEGECIGLRESVVVIGRDKGNVTIPFDGDISSRHAELRCHKKQGKYRWYLRDLESTNGTFLRSYRARLSSETEIIFGSRRYCFHLPDQSPSSEGDGPEVFDTQAYRAPPRTMLQQFVPRLVEVGVETAEPTTFVITEKNMRIGRDPTCEIAIPDDPFLSPQHGCFTQDERGRWIIEDKSSANGIWIRVKRMVLDQQHAEFQLGQQRFHFIPKLSPQRPRQ